jgi:DNA-binding SARP family transcriptional activator/tetratricopeptide (TPR) repeat protein
MRFRVLGPLQVRYGNGWAQVDAPKLRVLLAVLLIEAGRVVSVDRLVEELWGQRPPKRATATVRVFVGRLRQLLQPDARDLLVTRDAGYMLVREAAMHDAAEFEDLVGSARATLTAGRVEQAVEGFTEALALWQGPALADVPASSVVTAWTTWWEQFRLGVLEDKLGAELTLGRHGEVVDQLHRLVTEQPMRERLRAHYILALYRCGRRSEALAAYRDARRTLVDELGLEPGPGLRGLERAILTDDQQPPTAPAALAAAAPGPVAPAQLPAAVPDFTGRASQVEQLDALLGAVEAVVISTVAGAAGVGKTALAVYWAHRVAEWFPDGQLYVNLRGYAADPALSPMDVLARFLPALGVAPEQVPSEQDAAVGLYRSLLADRRMLVLLDNAHHPDQVRPLLPANPGCLVLVTSRDRLRGLVARDGAVGIDLDVLTPAEAGQLLARLLGPQRVAAEPDATARLARLCGYLPLAVRIAAANLAAHPQTLLADFTDQLADGDRLAALEVSGDPHAGVRVAFDHSYTALSADAGRLFRLLGLVPGPDFTPAAAAALADLPGPVTSRLLDQLTNSHLIEAHEPGRYRLHDLLRLYAADRAAAEDSQPERAAALNRLHDHYLGRVDAAARLLYPQVLRLPMPFGEVTGTGFAGHAEALAWLDLERPNLVAAVRHAADSGDHEAAWRLADALRGYLYLGVHMVDWQVVAQAGLRAADADRQLRAQAAAHLNLASLHATLERYQLAVDHNTTAARLSRAAGWRECESAALGQLATIYLRLGEVAQAVEHLAAALAIDQQVGWKAGQAAKLANLSIMWMLRGRLDLAIDHATQSLALHRQTQSRGGEGNSLTLLGDLHHLAGRLDHAQRTLTEALALHRDTGYRASESFTLGTLAAVHHTAGRYRQAHELAETALATAQQVRDPRSQVQALIYWVEAHRDLRQHRRAVAAARRAVLLARDQAPDVQTQAMICLAETLRHAGHPGLAAGAAGSALATAQRAGYRLREGEALTVLAACHLDSHQPGPALDHAEQAIAVNSQTGRRLYQAHAHLVAGAARQRLGDPTAADAHQRHARTILAEMDTGTPA